MITLIGVGHVFRLAEEIRDFIFTTNPDVVAIELDRQKLAHLLCKKVMRQLQSKEEKRSEERISIEITVTVAGKKVGQSGKIMNFDYTTLLNDKGDVSFEILNPKSFKTEGFYLRRRDMEEIFFQKKKRGIPFKYKLVEAIQNRLARENQVEAGDEMLAAFESAFYLNRKVALIDMDTREILMRIHQNMSLKENVRFLFSILAGMIKTKKDVTDELFKYESDYSTYMSEFEKKFPVLKRELIDNRNKHMAENILNLAKEYNHVLAVVGEGHIEGIKELLLKTIPSEALRIKHLFDFEEFRKLLGERK